ncbi:hypothetical protein [Komagataeibacter phage phiKX2]|nr:hypothetical protein [Komagataeibacter phage phiKX2]
MLLTLIYAVLRAAIPAVARQVIDTAALVHPYRRVAGAGWRGVGDGYDADQSSGEYWEAHGGIISRQGNER